MKPAGIIGIILIVIGIVALALATYQHRRDMKKLRAHHPEVPQSLATIIAALISFLGILALVAVLFHV